MYYKTVQKYFLKDVILEKQVMFSNRKKCDQSKNAEISTKLDIRTVKNIGVKSTKNAVI